MLHLDPRRPGVCVPPQFVSDPVLRLNIAYGFNLPALDIDDEGVYAVLSFGGRDFGCTIPWDAVFAMTLPHDEHEGVVFPAAVPTELQGAMETATEPVPVATEQTAEEAPRFAVIEGGGEPAEKGTEQSQPSLTLVKG